MPAEETEHISGTEVNYYFVCKRKLWLSSHGLEMESEADIVRKGKLTHKYSYKRKRKEIGVGRIRIDLLEEKGMVHEVKTSPAMEEAHKYQLLYYLYNLKNNAGVIKEGVLDYPLLHKKVKVSLDEASELDLEHHLKAIADVKELPKPPVVERMRICRSCAYRDLCWC